MGTLGGHLLPGSFFIGFALWWSFVTAIRYIQSKQRREANQSAVATYHSTVTMPCICLPSRRLRRAPIESWVKILFTTIGILGEILTGLRFNYVRPMNKDDASFFGCDSSGEQLLDGHNHHKMKASDGMPLPVFFEYVNAQHITMYAVFLLGGIVELFTHARAGFVPAKLDMGCGVIAFSIEAFLFAFHLHSRAPLDIRLHVLLVYAIFGCVLFGVLEIIRPQQILFTYGRIACTCLQGTWFWQAGFILYPPFDWSIFIWDRCDHEQVMTITMMFCWHFILIFIGLFVQLWFIERLFRSCESIRMRFNDLIEIDARNRTIDEDTKDVTSYLTCPNEDDFCCRDDEKIALTDDTDGQTANNQSKRILLDEFV